MADNGPVSRTVTIASGQTVSDAEKTGRLTLIGLITPAALTGTALTFQVSIDNITFVPLYDSTGAQVSLPVSTSRGFALDPVTFLPWRYVKVVSGSAEGAERIITLTMRPVA